MSELINQDLISSALADNDKMLGQLAVRLLGPGAADRDSEWPKLARKSAPKELGGKQAGWRELKEVFFAGYAEELVAAATNPEVWNWYGANKRISMWDPPMLCAATVLGAIAKGPIVEIGAYIGGGTVAFARGAAIGGARIISVEKGGSHPDHPKIPSRDILSDLKRNAELFEIADRLTLIEGNYGDDHIQQALADALGGEKVGLICIDADGHVDRAFNLMARHLTEGTIVVIDDYESITRHDKSPLTKPSVDLLCRLGYCEQWGIIGGESWIGQIANIQKFVKEKQFLTRLLTLSEVLSLDLLSAPEREKGIGFIYVARIPNHYCLLSDDATNERSPLLLLEDGKLLGPAHYPFAYIRDFGGGIYTHFRENLWFSTSDNSDPRENGRTYEILLGRERLQLIFS